MTNSTAKSLYGYIVGPGDYLIRCHSLNNDIEYVFEIHPTENTTCVAVRDLISYLACAEVVRQIGHSPRGVGFLADRRTMTIEPL